MIGVNLSAALDVKYSNNQVIEIYFGSTKIWPLTHDYSLDYFTITSLEDANTITFSSYYSSNVENLQYSLDGNTWNSYPSGGITINTDDKVLLRGTNMSVNTTTGQQTSGIGNILASKTINVEGNIMSLIYGELFVNATTIQEVQFASLFKGTSSSNYNKIVSAANLVLPSMTLTKKCYDHMFCDNRLLIEAPELPALTLTESCYDCMFQNTGLTTTPPLPATSLAYCCYGGMFQQCSKLTSAFLPATTLVNNCYQYMFYSSHKLNEITCLGKNPGSNNLGWCIGVSSTGTFYKDKDTDWSGVSSYSGGIPDGWEVKNYNDYPTLYFTIKALSNGYVSFSGSGISYSKNDGEWTQYTQSLYLNTNDEVKWKGTLTPEMVGGIGTFNATCRYIAYGNIMSLLYGDNFENQTTLSGKSYAFKHLFINNTYLEEADNLILPSTILSEGCYDAMFKGCTSLDKFPVLLESTLAPSCYKEMFKGCTLLDTMPGLSATTLAQSCYESMFEGCTSLTSASLPATTLVTDCYKEMFKNCSSLNNISAQFLTDPAGGTYTSNWVYGVAATGTFRKNPSATWTETGVNGVPTGWTVQTLPYDYEVEYLQGDGKAYIDLGIPASTFYNVDFELKFEILQNKTYVFGGCGVNNRQFTIYLQRYRFDWCGSYSFSNTLSLNQPYIIKQENDTLTVDGTSIAVNKQNISANMALFEQDTTKPARDTTFDGRIYYFKCTSPVDGSLVYNYISVVKDGVPCMYDTVNDIFYYNARNEGAFTAGPRV